MNVFYTVSSSLIQAFALTWDMYKDAIENIPDADWRTGTINYLIPARLVYHVLEASDYYSGTSEDNTRGKRFNIDWQEASPSQLPSKDQTLVYLDEVRGKVESWLAGIDDEGFVVKQNIFVWTGRTVLSRALYLLSHCRQHFGEINAELRNRGLPRIVWRTF